MQHTTLIRTNLTWEDLVVAPDVLTEIENIRKWLQADNPQQQQASGYRALFCGPPGTGKTLTATLLSKSAGVEVYRVDLGSIWSTGINEATDVFTEIFDIAETNHAILLFDTYGMIFEKPGETNNPQPAPEILAFVKLMSNYEELLIMTADNLTALSEIPGLNFDSTILFSKPDTALRLQLWRNAFAPPVQLMPEVNLPEIATIDGVTGGIIINVLRYCALAANKRGDNLISSENIKDGLKVYLR